MVTYPDVSPFAPAWAAAAGKTLFMTHCASCHNASPYVWTEANKYEKRFIQMGLVPQKFVGTDLEQFEELRPFEAAH